MNLDGSPLSLHAESLPETTWMNGVWVLYEDALLVVSKPEVQARESVRSDATVLRRLNAAGS